MTTARERPTSARTTTISARLQDKLAMRPCYSVSAHYPDMVHRSRIEDGMRAEEKSQGNDRRRRTSGATKCSFNMSENRHDRN